MFLGLQNSIIDGEGTFLVSERGCDTILGMLLTAQERIVMIQVSPKYPTMLHPCNSTLVTLTLASPLNPKPYRGEKMNRTTNRLSRKHTAQCLPMPITRITLLTPLVPQYRKP